MKRVLMCLSVLLFVGMMSVSLAHATARTSYNEKVAANMILSHTDSLMLYMEKVMWSAPAETILVVDTTSFEDGAPIICDLLDTIIVSGDSFYVCTDSTFIEETIGLDSLVRAIGGMSVTVSGIDALTDSVAAMKVKIEAILAADTTDRRTALDSIAARTARTLDSLHAVVVGLSGISVNVTTPDLTVPYYFGSMVQDSTAWIKPAFRFSVISYSLQTYTANDGPFTLYVWSGGDTVAVITEPGPGINIGAQGSILPPVKTVPCEGDSIQFKATGAIDHAEVFVMGDANP